jgi:hypothetical protein
MLAQTIQKVSIYEEQVKVAENERNEALAAYDALEKTRSKDGVHKELEQVRRQTEEERKELSRYKAKLKEARESYSKLMDSVKEKDVKTRKLEEMVFAAETETKLELKRLSGLSSVGIEEKVMRLQEELAAKEKDALRLAGEVDALMGRAEMMKTTKEHQVQVLELSLARTQQIKKIRSDMEEKSMHSSGALPMTLEKVNPGTTLRMHLRSQASPAPPRVAECRKLNPESLKLVCAQASRATSR